MKAGDIKCRKCGQDAMQAADRGAWLERVSPKGIKPMIMECAPSCEHKHGNQDDALLGAIEGPRK